jgi:hypothetical protein
MSEHPLFKNFKLELLDRILFIGVLATHLLAISEVGHEYLKEHFDVTSALILYVIIVSLFWTIFTFYFCAKQIKIKDRQLANEKTLIEAEIALLKQECDRMQSVKGYVEAYEHIGMGFAKIHQLQRKMQFLDPQSLIFKDQTAFLIQDFGEVCTHIAEGFRLITGKEDIAVCIKLLSGNGEPTGRSSVYTLVRDARSTSRRGYDERKIYHIIENNTSYYDILRLLSKAQLGRRFISNNLPQYPGYKNSSFIVHGQAEWNNSLSAEQRDNNWLLPYRSTIVTGIYPEHPDIGKNNNLIGYLCIDSNNIDVFNEKYDTPILTGVADGIYNTLMQFKQLKHRNIKKAK